MLFSLLPLLLSAQVPLDLYTNSDWPAGVDLGAATGVSFGDLDGDGDADIFVCNTGKLWSNQGGGNWLLANDLSGFMPGSLVRYGAAFGDYNRDGLADIATEPRKPGDSCLHLFRNSGSFQFIDVSVNPQLVLNPPCETFAETAVFADFDGDGDLDLFFPTYGAGSGSPGNRFMQNMGPTGPGGAYRLMEVADLIGVAQPDGSARPEGVVTLDIDRDGDLDLYSNGHWYRNLSTLGAPSFIDLASKASGVKRRTVIDEGTVAVDYDGDGDLDLLVSYTAGKGNRLWINLGDGTFRESSDAVVEDFVSGSGYGLSVADWDNDGDLDFTANDVFRESQLADGAGAEWKIVAAPQVPQVGAPAWADFDLDGDLDLATADGSGSSFIYENQTYGPDTPAADKRHLRVRVVDAEAGVSQGVETEFGAVVEVKLLNVESSRRYVQLVSGAAGYINQNEYPLHFALPADPVPADASRDVRFDLVVEFPSLPELGFHRVDKRVNPALGNLDLALLSDREVTVFRDGTVLLNGTSYSPVDPAQVKLVTTTNGLIQNARNAAMPDLIPATSANEFVGIEFDTLGRVDQLRLTELILDGAPGAPGWCGDQWGNVGVWDVTSAGSPTLVGAFEASLPAGEHRAATDCQILLDPGRVYRVVARVNSYRSTELAGAWAQEGIQVRGGIHYTDTDPCTGLQLEQQAVNPAEVYLALRVRADAEARWYDLGHASPGSLGQTPVLVVDGSPTPGAPLTFTISQAPPLTPVRLIVGGRLFSGLQNGVEIEPTVGWQQSSTTDTQGRAQFSGAWPTQLTVGSPLFFQALVGSDRTSAAKTQVQAALTESQ